MFLHFLGKLNMYLIKVSHDNILAPYRLDFTDSWESPGWPCLWDPPVGCRGCKEAFASLCHSRSGPSPTWEQKKPDIDDCLKLNDFYWVRLKLVWMKDVIVFTFYRSSNKPRSDWVPEVQQKPYCVKYVIKCFKIQVICGIINLICNPSVSAPELCRKA